MNMHTHPAVIGSIPDVFWNVDRLYEGTLWHYMPQILSAPNRNNGYHNTRHTLHMAWLGYMAGLYYREELSPRRIRNMLVAKIKHDHGHSGRPTSEVPDEENLRVAEASLRENAAPEDRAHLDDIAEIMWATEFPHRPIAQPSLEQRIIRDSDVTQALHPAWFDLICVGLGTEWSKTPLEMLQVQEPFLRSIRFETEWAQQRFPAVAIEKKVTEVRGLLQGLQSVS